MKRHGWLLAVLGSVAAVGCGADGYSGDDDDVVTDAGASYCDMSVSVSPTSPQAPATIVATGSIDTSWLSGCQSWYLDRNGKNSTLWPGFSISYWWRTRRFDLDVYETSR